MNEKENGIIVSNQVVEMAPLSCNIVSNDIEENGLEMWNHCITNEFPICEVIRKGNEVILNIGSPHNGFVIESAMNEGKLNGKAIMKNDKGVLIGEFEYVNGEANGSCKLYNENGVLYFEGYLKNGYREGIGKEYDEEGNVIFEGIFVKGMRKNGIRIEDDYMIEYDEEGNRIIGYKKNDKCEKNGICYLYKDNKVCEVWKYDNNEKVCILIKFEGNKMIEYNENGRMIYRGGYIESKKYRYIRNGFGKLYNNKGKVIYEGEWKNGRRQGKGTMVLNDHRLFSGKWILNCPLPVLILGFIIVIVLIILLIVGINIQNRRKVCMGYYSDSSLIIESNHCNEFYISSFSPKSSLEYIDIGGNCCKNVNIFVINGMNELKSLKIGDNSFTKNKSSKGNDSSHSFSILNCIELKSIEIGSFSFCDYGGGFELRNLPKLSTIKIGEIDSWSFDFYYSSFEIYGIIDMILLMNRSSTFEFYYIRL